MTKYLIILFFSSSLFSSYNYRGYCLSHPDVNNDSTISLFGNYKLKLHVFNQEIEDMEVNNSILTFIKKEDGKEIILSEDSLHCHTPRIELKDFNNDKIKDVLIFYSYDVRSNKMYHLYLINNKLKKLIRVKGFEEIKNPEFNAKENLIESHVVSGTNYHCYYRINKLNKLIDFKKIIYD